MSEVEKTIAFIVDGQPVANIGVDGKLVVPAEQPISVVHVEQRVEDAKFDLGGGYHDNSPVVQSMVG